MNGEEVMAVAVVGSSWQALEGRRSEDEILQSDLKGRGASAIEGDSEIKKLSCESQKTWPISTEENGVSNLTKEEDENNNQRISEKLPSLECDADKILEKISNPCETARELDTKDNHEEEESQSFDVMEGESNPPIDALEPQHVGSVTGLNNVTVDEEDLGELVKNSSEELVFNEAKRNVNKAQELRKAWFGCDDVSNPKVEIQGKSKSGMMGLREESSEEQDDTPKKKDESAPTQRSHLRG